MIAQPLFESYVGTTLGSYYLERLVGRNELGPVFLGSAGPGPGYLIRFVTAPAALGAEARSIYQGRFQRLASEVAALQHRHILPLLDYGSHQGMSYLVTPGMPMQTVISSLVRNGRPDLATVERYLDEIVQALEYAHEQDIIHGNLTTDCIFILRDGRLVVGDFGVMRLLELTLRDGEEYPEYGSGEGRAPEQILRRPMDVRTDVYALGAVLYRLLTGHSVFTRGPYRETCEQHLHAQVPSLRRWRTDLPAELDEVIALAMAKEPADRFQRPTAFLSAYRQVMQGADAAEQQRETAGDTPPIVTAAENANAESAPGLKRLLSRLRHPFRGEKNPSEKA